MINVNEYLRTFDSDRVEAKGREKKKETVQSHLVINHFVSFVLRTN